MTPDPDDTIINAFATLAALVLTAELGEAPPTPEQRRAHLRKCAPCRRRVAERARQRAGERAEQAQQDAAAIPVVPPSDSSVRPIDRSRNPVVRHAHGRTGPHEHSAWAYANHAPILDAEVLSWRSARGTEIAQQRDDLRERFTEALDSAAPPVAASDPAAVVRHAHGEQGMHEHRATGYANHFLIPPGAEEVIDWRSPHGAEIARLRDARDDLHAAPGAGPKASGADTYAKVIGSNIYAGSGTTWGALTCTTERALARLIPGGCFPSDQAGDTTWWRFEECPEPGEVLLRSHDGQRWARARVQVDLVDGIL